jgi:hypothetical protein
MASLEKNYYHQLSAEVENSDFILSELSTQFTQLSEGIVGTLTMTSLRPKITPKTITEKKEEVLPETPFAEEEEEKEEEKNKTPAAIIHPVIINEDASLGAANFENYHLITDGDSDGKIVVKWLEQMKKKHNSAATSKSSNTFQVLAYFIDEEKCTLEMYNDNIMHFGNWEKRNAGDATLELPSIGLLIIYVPEAKENFKRVQYIDGAINNNLPLIVILCEKKSNRTLSSMIFGGKVELIYPEETVIEDAMKEALKSAKIPAYKNGIVWV